MFGTASSMVEQVTLNHLVGGSSPSRCKFQSPCKIGTFAGAFHFKRALP